MALIDPAAQSASLDNDYGATAGPNAPSAHQVALFNGDPLNGGTELAATGGYARVTIPNDGTSWLAASDGSKVSNPVTFPASSDAWSDTATHFVLYDDADGTTAWDSGLLSDEVAVDVASTVVETTLTIYYATS